jgi:hypothetical protein
MGGNGASGRAKAHHRHIELSAPLVPFELRPDVRLRLIVHHNAVPLASPAPLELEIENSRVEIAKLQDRIKKLVAKRSQRDELIKKLEAAALSSAAATVVSI